MSQSLDDEYHKILIKKEAYDEGYQGYKTHGDRNLNPYNNNDEWELSQAWLEGFMDAAWDD